MAPVLEQEKLASLNELCHRLRNQPSEPLRRKVVECMTTHETLFFRDPAVFDALRSELIPSLVRERQGTRTLRIWSAACWSGQEPYSLAMLLLEAGLAGWNLQILGTDLSYQILDRARSGQYLQIEVNRGLPAQLLVKYFQRTGRQWQIKEEVRRMVRFTPFDLRQPMNTLGPFDLVLCRNVLIYFELETRRRILTNLRTTIVPGGYLLLGSSETTFNLDESFVRTSVKSSSLDFKRYNLSWPSAIPDSR